MKNARKEALYKPSRSGVNNGLTKDEANNKAVGAPSKNLRKTTVGDTDGDEQPQRVSRTKERTITDIIEKVSTWRKLYNGVMVKNP